MRTVATAGLVLLAAVAVGSACGGSPEILGKIATADGEYSVTKIEVGDRLPVDCSNPADCTIGPPDCSSCNQRLKEGRQVVVVWLEPRFEAEGPTEVQGRCLGEGGPSQIYIEAHDGAATPCSAASFGEPPVALVFMPPASASGFTLFVPENRPIELGR